MLSGLGQHWRELRDSSPGHRFQERYERHQRSPAGKGWSWRILRPLAGAVLLVGGIILCLIPGPGLPLVFIGAALLADRSRMVARLLDGLELLIRKIIRRGNEWWHRASRSARYGIVFAALSDMAGAGYGAHQVIFGRLN